MFFDIDGCVKKIEVRGLLIILMNIHIRKTVSGSDTIGRGNLIRKTTKNSYPDIPEIFLCIGHSPGYKLFRK